MKYKLIKEYPGSPNLGTIKDSENYIPAMEHMKNYPEFWQPVVEKDYEILSFKDKCSTRILILKNNMYRDGNMYLSFDKLINNTRYWQIHSVKRLSDDEVFTIGDKLETGIIKKFYLPDNIQKEITIHVTKDDEDTYLSEAKHIKQPLFTTEDGVDIFEDDTFVIVNKFDLYICNSNVTSKEIYNKIWDGSDGYLQFSTKEKAEEYILMNKPCLSLNDIFKEVEETRKGLKTFENSQLAKRFKKLVQQKLKL